MMGMVRQSGRASVLSGATFNQTIDANLVAVITCPISGNHFHEPEKLHDMPTDPSWV